MSFRLYLVQRVTALMMAPLIVGHIAIILVATSGGLSAGEILERTRGSVGWAAFYGAFVVLASVHAAIGVRTILQEWAGVRGMALDALAWSFAGLLALLGLRAVIAVVAPGALP